jgi:ankyrin repeat protein
MMDDAQYVQLPSHPVLGASTSDRFAFHSVDSWALPGPGLARKHHIASVSSITSGESVHIQDFLRAGTQLEGLHKAAANGDEAAIMSIMKMESQRHNHIMYTGLDALDLSGRTPLMYAVIAEALQCVGVLIEYGALREQMDPDGRTALHYASFYGKHRAVQLLLDRGANILARDVYGRTALHWAAAISNTKCLTILIQYAVFQQIGVDWVDNDRMVPLQVAAQFGRSKHIAMLLKAGANAECTDIEGKTSLHWCLNNTDTDSIITLCKACPAILNARDANGATLLHWASAQGQAHIVNCLIAMEGCDLNRRDEWSCTAIHYTCLYGHSNCLQMLLAYGAHDQVTDMNG